VRCEAQVKRCEPQKRVLRYKTQNINTFVHVKREVNEHNLKAVEKEKRAADIEYILAKPTEQAIVRVGRLCRSKNRRENRSGKVSFL